MLQVRKILILLKETPYYHCVYRCVGREFLWSTDHFSRVGVLDIHFASGNITLP